MFFCLFCAFVREDLRVVDEVEVEVEEEEEEEGPVLSAPFLSEDECFDDAVFDEEALVGVLSEAAVARSWLFLVEKESKCARPILRAVTLFNASSKTSRTCL